MNRQSSSHQPFGHRVEHRFDVHRGPTTHPHAQNFIVGAAISWQRLQQSKLSGIFLGAFGIQFGHHRGDERPILRQAVKVETAPQIQLLHQSAFEVAVRGFNRAILMRYTCVVAARAHLVVVTERSIALCEAMFTAAIVIRRT
jgi:hypothetical protein